MSRLKTLIWPQVILFGDSITQNSFQVNGWGSGIADKLARWGRIVLPRIVHQDELANISAVTVFFGANDCALQGIQLLILVPRLRRHRHATLRSSFLSGGDKNPQQHVPLHEYSENLKAMSSHLAKAGVPAGKVIFITPPPIHEAAWEKECKLKGCPLNRLNSVAGQYAQACVQAATQCGVDVLDLWTLMQNDGQDFTVYLSDGLHLSEKGNQFVMQHLWKLLESRVAHLPFILPYWGDVDAGVPENSLLCDQ
ncbi:isoamyl acetate-hydrolyzing esterase 1 homolog isoform X2 [Hippocampus zosterae]|uniref:isoamyl acetate-hydrolyzing esterase 1 homolog isoform X2 n=1 Tax=Hippocampus zosterae TaxID=109293 RepID=UPI00223DB8E5|nr:isoamyl acetate-hydrolyzing esterase 1 homolog isoform X2 [Hippocampus zosterae]